MSLMALQLVHTHRNTFRPCKYISLLWLPFPLYWHLPLVTSELWILCFSNFKTFYLLKYFHNTIYIQMVLTKPEYRPIKSFFHYFNSLDAYVKHIQPYVINRSYLKQTGTMPQNKSLIFENLLHFSWRRHHQLRSVHFQSACWQILPKPEMLII